MDAATEGATDADLGLARGGDDAAFTRLVEPLRARAHRMGETRPVVVYRLIAAESIDEHVVRLSGIKAELFGELARRSALAEAAPDLAVGVREVSADELFTWARNRYGL